MKCTYGPDPLVGVKIELPLDMCHRVLVTARRASKPVLTFIPLFYGTIAEFATHCLLHNQ